MRAIFVGENSLGYKSGIEYDLTISIVNKIYIQRADGTGLCIYDNIFQFLKNWRPIVKIRKPQAQMIIVDDLGDGNQMLGIERKEKLEHWYKTIISTRK